MVSAARYSAGLLLETKRKVDKCTGRLGVQQRQRWQMKSLIGSCVQGWGLKEN